MPFSGTGPRPRMQGWSDDRSANYMRALLGRARVALASFVRSLLGSIFRLMTLSGSLALPVKAMGHWLAGTWAPALQPSG